MLVQSRSPPKINILYLFLESRPLRAEHTEDLHPDLHQGEPEQQARQELQDLGDGSRGVYS